MIDAKLNLNRYYIFFAIIGCVSILISILSLINTKNVEADEKIESRLSSISSDLSALDYEKNATELPDTLDGVTKESLEGITYKKIDDTHYELCASFKTSTREGKNAETRNSEDTSIFAYEHDKGKDCFRAKVNFYSKSSSQRSNTSSYEDITPTETKVVGQPAVLCGKSGTYYSGKVGVIDSTQKRIYQNGAVANSTNFTRYDVATKFYDKNCKLITIDSLKAGDSIHFVSNIRGGFYFADAIAIQ